MAVVEEIEFRVFGGEGGDKGGRTDGLAKALQAGQVASDWHALLHLLV